MAIIVQLHGIKMLVRLCSSPRYFGLFIATAVFLLLLFASLLPLSYPLQEQDPPKRPLSHSKSSQPATSISPILSLPLPQRYALVPSDETEFCADRFGTRYLTNLRDHSHEYCDTLSTSSVRCFYSNTADRRIDTFCLARSATFDPVTNKFSLDCNVSIPDPKVVHGIPDLNHLSTYWYDTGPRVILHDYIDLHKPSPGSPREVNLPAPKNFTVLLKREGDGNLWHCLMEILSLTLSFDTLQISRDSKTSEPLFTTEDMDRTQVVILDGHSDGPYFDLWRLFAKKPIVRLNELGNQTDSSNIIIPLAGGGSPFWQGDWEVLSCKQSSLLHTFIGRMIAFFDIKTTSEPQGDIMVTFINRVQQRRLIDQHKLIDAAKSSLDHVRIQVIDLASLPFKEQIQIIRDSDVLIGVHGAGLTHGLWLRPGSVMAEILPPNINHKGFRNLAGMLDHKYFSAHAGAGIEERGWHAEDVHIEEERFVKLVEMAVKNVYNQGSRSFDVV